MTVKVLVVDDSSFFRRRVSEILNADPKLEVVACAVNGKEAVEAVTRLKPDVITMDIEMPVMDGISAVKEIMKAHPTPILMFSSLTHEGAKATLDALDAGALDYLPKKFEDIARNKDEAIMLLQHRVEELSRKRLLLRRPLLNSIKPKEALTPHATQSRDENPAPPPVLTKSRIKASGKHYQLLAIGASTGGPVALQQVLTSLPENFPYPILLIQHMPAAFTSAFAERLNTLCKIQVKEACDKEILKPGTAYLAPGGLQMLIEGRPTSPSIKIFDSGDRVNYKPSVDLTLGSAANVFHDKVLSLILTGMGCDGRDGARMLTDKGATVWAQDESTSVVYGMPQAVMKASLATQSLPLPLIADSILTEMNIH